MSWIIASFHTQLLHNKYILGKKNVFLFLNRGKNYSCISWIIKKKNEDFQLIMMDINVWVTINEKIDDSELANQHIDCNKWN